MEMGGHFGWDYQKLPCNMAQSDTVTQPQCPDPKCNGWRGHPPPARGRQSERAGGAQVRHSYAPLPLRCRCNCNQIRFSLIVFALPLARSLAGWLAGSFRKCSRFTLRQHLSLFLSHNPQPPTPTPPSTSVIIVFSLLVCHIFLCFCFVSIAIACLLFLFRF